MLDFINGLDTFYSTSSCSGRIVLLDDSGVKGEGGFKGVWHEKRYIGIINKMVKKQKERISILMNTNGYLSLQEAKEWTKDKNKREKI